MKQEKLNYSNLTPLPNNFLAEQAILNIILTSPSLLSTITTKLKVEAFYFEPHRILYEVVFNLEEEQVTVNVTNLITRLQDRALLTKIGGVELIVSIINNFHNFCDLEHYVTLVNEKYLRRLIIEIGKQNIVWGYTTSEKIEDILGKVEQSLLGLNQENLSQKVYSAAEIMDEVFIEMKSKIETNSSSGYRSSFPDLDSIIQGFQKSDLIIIAGRPSMGKTAFALSLAKNIMIKYQIPLLIFTLEMSRQQIMYRFLSSTSQINANRLKSGKMTLNEWKELSRSMKELANLPLFIDDNPNLTFLDIRSKLKKVLTQKKKEGLVIIDYLQLMKITSKLENRVQEISYITRNLKILAKEFEVPILLLSQLSRNVESRINKRPMLSDLRESGCITLDPKFHLVPLESWKKNQIDTNLPTPFHFKGMKPTFKITLGNQKTLCLSSTHKLLSRQGWVNVSQLMSTIEVYCLIKTKDKTPFCSYAYETIEKIEYQGIQPVYDKIIPEYHNYLKNDVVLHNSIEQDADIVIMLYRDDYYSETKEIEPITECLVVKHRNGPTGTARLLFNSLTTSFSNLTTAKNQI